MRVIFSNALVNDTNSSFHGEVVDISVEKGLISEVSKNRISENSIDLSGSLLTPSLVDMCAHFNEPGTEFKEDLSSGCKAAAFSGFTDVCVLPNTSPVLENKSAVQYVSSRSNHGVSLHSIAAISEQCDGENLTEILDLQEAGAIAFSDGLRPVWNTELLLKALQYVQKFDGLIVNRAKDFHLSKFTHMHEGLTSTMLGLKGEPSISEELSIKRDLDVLRYAGGRLHFAQISTANSVALIRSAKKEGLSVTCDVAIHQLIYTDVSLLDYDTNFKVDPPLRSEKDRKALVKGVKDGSIDAIVSSHQPQDSESKELEFDLASFGINSLPTVYSLLESLDDELPIDIGLNRFSAGPRRILGLEGVKIEVGSPAKFSVFNRSDSWVFDRSSNLSKSRNSPLFGQALTGFCVGIFDGQKFYRN